VRIVRRTIVLILLGLFLNSFGRIVDFLSGDIEAFSFATLRFPGVLQRIAIVYFITSLIALHVPLRAQVVFGAVLLMGYWALLGFLPNPGEYQRNLSPDGNVEGLVDRAIVTPQHMYTYDQESGRLDEMTEPEGIISTFPAVVTCMLGYWSGLAIQRRGINYDLVVLLLGCGALCVEIGLLWNLTFPINKKIWTSSFVLLTGGLAMQLLAGCLLKFDLWGWRRLARPFAVVGINAIFVYVAASLTATLLGRVRIGDGSAHQWLYENMFTSWIADPKLASVGMALATMTFWWIVCWVMSRLGWSIRV
jgi:predicted acyltransferase